MAWRVARSLNVLLEQINDRYPNRNKASDGSIGDADHQNRNSDHNPWYGPGIVTARDFTHDPDSGVDIDRLTDELAASRDRRIKYIIANNLILSGNGGPSPWAWRPYFGSNAHTRHFHLSVIASPACDDTTPWNLASLRSGGGGAAPGQEDDMPSAKEVAEEVWAYMIHNHQLGRKEWAKTSLGALQDRIVRQQIAPLRGEVAALAEAHRQDRAGEDRDLDAVRQAAREGTEQALAEGTVNVDIDVTGPEGSTT